MHSALRIGLAAALAGSLLGAKENAPAFDAAPVKPAQSAFADI